MTDRSPGRHFLAGWRIERRPEPRRIGLYRLTAVALGLALALILAPIISGASPDLFYETAWNGTLGSPLGIANFLAVATPLIIAGLAAAIPLRLGLWNIGIDGQILIGAWCATAVAYSFESLPGPILIPMLFIAGMIGGALWILVPALLFPAAAMLTASYWLRCVRDPSTRGANASVHLVMWLGFILAGAMACLPWIYDTMLASKLTKEYPLATQLSLGHGPYVAATVLLVGMGLVGLFGLSETRRGAAFWAAGGSLFGVVLVLMIFVLPAANRFFVAPQQELAYAAGLNLKPDEQLIAYGATRPSTAFYARRKVLFVGSGEEEKLRTALSQPGRSMILLPESFVDKLPGDLKNYQPILKRYGYLLLASEPMVKIPEGALPPPPALEPKIFGH